MLNWPLAKQLVASFGKWNTSGKTSERPIRPVLEVLEDRFLPASGLAAAALVTPAATAPAPATVISPASLSVSVVTLNPGTSGATTALTEFPVASQAEAPLLSGPLPTFPPLSTDPADPTKLRLVGGGNEQPAPLPPWITGQQGLPSEEEENTGDIGWIRSGSEQHVPVLPADAPMRLSPVDVTAPDNAP
jgi:hypothetical protein